MSILQVSSQTKNKIESSDEFERKPLPYLFEKELITNQNKYRFIFDNFTASKTIHPVTYKFYSKYEQSLGHLNNGQQIQREKIQYREVLPNLANQSYGWLPDNMNRSETQELNFINAPKIRCDLTVNAERIYKDRITERPAFNGLRFIV